MAEEFNAATWLCDRHVEEGRGERTAIVSGDRTLTYAELQASVHRVAGGLRSLDVRPEERVVLVLADGPDFVAAFLGCLRIGAVAVPVSTMLKPDEWGAIVADTRARVLVISGQWADHVPAIRAAAPELAEVVVDGHDLDGDDTTAYATWPDSPAFWLYTSGTTGTPKGAMHRHVDLSSTAETYARSVLGIGPDDRCFSVAKLFFAYGLGNALTFPFSVGATAILHPDPPTPAGVAEVLAATRPTLFFAVPGFYAAMLDAEVPADLLGSARLAVSAGEAYPAGLMERWTDRFGVEVLDGIGSTEALHIFLSNHPGRVRPGTSGTPVAGYDVRLLDDTDQEVAEPDVPGNLYVRGESVATGYWCRTAATRTAFRGEWLRTGDVYSRSADGYYTFLGRSNDVLKAGGIWVSPAEVENVLIGHDDVLEAAVVGARNADGLEEPVAFVVPRSGRSIDADALVAHCRDQLAAFKRPRRVIAIDAFPKTATGKVQRYALRERLTTTES